MSASMKAPAVKMLFVAFGAFAFLIGLGWLAYGGLLKVRGRSVEGTVVGHERSDADGTSFAPVVSFKTAEGRTIEFTSGEYLPREPPPLGQHVRVLYDPAAPQRAEIDSFETLWMMPAVFFATGLACVAAGFGAAWTLRQVQQAPR